ncbi:MAG TPA: large-conductance mechanosensitive channel protein MscL [bacterium]|nr:large-conductance mechanosensitive channel protein MscL [bacterium]
MPKIFQEFKEFAVKGNIMDLAVAVIIGGAFGKIVTSLVNDIIMPFFGFIMGGVKFTNLKWVMKDAIIGNDGAVIKEAISLNYGNFIQSTVDFLVIAWSIFIMIKILNKVRRKQEKEETVKENKESKEEILLTEIRDLLKKK